MPKKRPVKESAYFQDQKREKRQRHNPGFYTSFVKGLVSQSGHHEDRTKEKILPHPQKGKKTHAECLQKANKKKTAFISEEYSEFSLPPLPECEIETTECSSSSNPESKNSRAISKSVINVRNDVDSYSHIFMKDFACNSMLKPNLRIPGHFKEQRKQNSSSVTSNVRRNVVAHNTLKKDMKYVTKGRKHTVSAGSTCNIATVVNKNCERCRGQHPPSEDDKFKHTGIQCDMSSLQEDNAEDTSSFDSNGNGIININDILTADRAEHTVNARCGYNLDVCHNDKTFQTVSATMEEDIVSIPGMKEFLLRELPLQMNVLVQKLKERVVITGSIEQLNSIWTTLSKKKQEHYTKENKICEEREKALAEIVCNLDCSSLRSLNVSCMASDKDGTAQSSQTGQRVVFVEDGHGISLQVNVEVPVSQLSSLANITSPQPNQNCMSLSSIPGSSMNANRNRDDEECHKSIFAVSDIQESSPEGEVLALEEKVGAGNTSEETSDLMQISVSDEALLSQPENNSNFIISSQKAGKNYMMGTVDSLECVREERTVIVDGENVVSTILDEKTVDSSKSDTGPAISLTDPGMDSPSSGGFLASSQTLQCGLCNTVCQSEELALNHMKAVHKNGTLNTCEVCGVAFPDKRGLLAHLKAKHEGSGCTCQICGKKFQCHRYLRTHLQRHAGVKSFACTMCGWRFFEQNKLKFHMETHKTAEERNLPFKCNLCNKQFVNKATYSDHCNTHSGLRPFTCHVCNAAFGHRVGLRRHLKTIHEKARPYACSYCHKEFTYKAKLDSHLILHTGISKHRCELCEKVFTARTSLQRHRAKCSLGLKTTARLPLVQGTSPASQPDGEGDSIFLCGICDKAFANYEEAEHHIVLHDSRASSSSDGLVQEECTSTRDSEASHFLQSITTSQSEMQSVEAEVVNPVCYAVSNVSGVVTDQLGPKSSLEHSMIGGQDDPCPLRMTQRCTLKSLNEEEQVQLVASTLADLSTLC